MFFKRKKELLKQIESLQRELIVKKSDNKIYRSWLSDSSRVNERLRNQLDEKYDYIEKLELELENLKNKI